MGGCFYSFNAVVVFAIGFTDETRHEAQQHLVNRSNFFLKENPVSILAILLFQLDIQYSSLLSVLSAL